jgi:dihydroneopterin aldolase
MERIHITGLELFAFHGVNREERQHGQLFVLDMLLEADLSTACQSDDLRDTVNYAQVIKKAAAAFTAQPRSLIERAAEITAQAVLEGFPHPAGAQAGRPRHIRHSGHHIRDRQGKGAQR